MWLLNTATIELHEFRSDIPWYAILSHTWAEDEVTFEEIGKPEAKQKLGFQKILRCCAQAASDGFQWVWIDTCCIDKRSSAELSESINSMYRWYGSSQVCYAWLEDVTDGPCGRHLAGQFAGCKWFTRGWTLQELVASPNLIFFNRSWVEIGTKASLGTVISQITGIDLEILRNDKGLFETTIAHRMSWASRRQTTRVEDMAYCLLGIFNINMPLLYGEGNKAFIRLQLALLNVTADHTIFAWSIPNDKGLLATDDLSVEEPDDSPVINKSGLLAPSPAAFRDFGNIKRSHEKSFPHYMTNIGLSITLPLIRDQGPDPKVYVALLNCYREVPHHSRLIRKQICLFLKHEGNAKFYRLRLEEKLPSERNFWARTTPILTQVATASQDYSKEPQKIFTIRNISTASYGYAFRKAIDDQGKAIPIKPNGRLARYCSYAAFQFQNLDRGSFYVVVGEQQHETWMTICTATDEPLGPTIEYRHFTDRLVRQLPDGVAVVVALKRAQSGRELHNNIEVKIERPTIPSYFPSRDLDLEANETTPLLSQERMRNVGPPMVDQQEEADRDYWKSILSSGISHCLHYLQRPVAEWNINLLLVFVPSGIIASALRLDPVMVLALNCISLIPLASILRSSLEATSAYVGTLLARLASVLLRSPMELIFMIIALQRNELKILQQFMLGSIILHVLLNMGCCCIASGIRSIEQDLNSTEASRMHSQLAVALATLILPASLYAVLSGSSKSCTAIIFVLSHVSAVILIVLYGAYILYQYKSPPNFFTADDPEEVAILEVRSERERLNLLRTSSALVLSAAATAICTINVIDSCRPASNKMDTGAGFTSFILIPLACNITTMARSIMTTHRHGLDLAIHRVFQGTMDLAMFILPLSLILGWILDIPMTLHYELLETIIFFISVLLANYLLQVGKGSSLGGGMSLATYIIVGVTIFCVPSDVRIGPF